MSRYHVDTPAQLALVQVALDQSFGLRNAAGVATPIERMVYRPDVGLVPASRLFGPVHGHYDQPGTHWPILDGGDGTAALRVPDVADVPTIAGKLGRTVSGVPVPAAGALVQVTRARDNALLPAGVRDKLDDAYADTVYAQNTNALGVTDTATANAAITAELQNGSRAANAITRKGVRGSQAALEKAMGLGRAEE